MRMLVLLMILSLAFASCVSEDQQGQDWGNILAGVDGLQLTADNHPDGWMKEDCFGCHPEAVIHQQDRSGIGVLLLKDIREFVQQEGLSACPICHGDNGNTE